MKRQHSEVFSGSGRRVTIERMDSIEPPHRRRFELPAIRVLAFVAVLAAVIAPVVAWKWLQSVSRQRCLSELRAKGVVALDVSQIVKWSAEWPFHNVARVVVFELDDGTYGEDDIRRLRQTFPEVPIYHVDPSKSLTHVVGPEDLVELSED